MAFQKRLDYGFNGYQVPRSCRSARGRSSLKRKIEDTQMGAFELLATVAGKLLQEREASPAHSNVSGGSGTKLQATLGKDNVKQEQRDEEKSLKVESCDQGNSQETTSLVLKPNHNKSSEEFTHVVSDHASLMVNCDKSEKAEGTVIGNSRNQMVPDTCNLDDMLDSDTKPPALVSSDSSIEQHPTPCPFPGCQGNVKLVSRDDDDNSSGCTQPSTTPLKASRPPPRLEDRKIRKFLESKYWEVAPKLEGELSNTDGDIKPVSRNKNVFYTRQRSLKEYFQEEVREKSSFNISRRGWQ